MAVKRLLLLLCLVIGLLNNAYTQHDPVSELRKELFYNDFDLERSAAFYNKIASIKLNTPTVIAYRAAARALMAKYTWNPVTKINNLNSMEELLNKAVNTDGSNLEVRFLRFYIENSIPAYLGYSKNMNEDSHILTQNLHRLKELNIDQEIANFIFRYISNINIEVSP